MTTLVKRSPFIELEPVDRWLNTMLSGIGFEVPGFVEKELAVEITGRMLTITGKHVEEKEEEKAFRLHERLANEFERTFMLPPEVDLEKITSIFANGVLKVYAPLPVEATPHKVPITTR